MLNAGSSTILYCKRSPAIRGCGTKPRSIVGVQVTDRKVRIKTGPPFESERSARACGSCRQPRGERKIDCGSETRLLLWGVGAISLQTLLAPWSNFETKPGYGRRRGLSLNRASDACTDQPHVNGCQTLKLDLRSPQRFNRLSAYLASLKTESVIYRGVWE